MDQASTLVAELHSKLDALDERVSSFRHQMSCEFDRYKDDLLRDAPVAVRQQVDRALRARLESSPVSRFRAPEEQRPASSGSPTDGDGSASLSLPPPKVQDGLDTGLRSPHEREQEFQGIFTPGYLPLLDSTDRHERRSSSLSDVLDAGVGGVTPVPARSMSDDVGAYASSSFDGSSSKPKPPTPRRRNTDELSVVSDGSDGPVRRSALRRSSSGTAKPMVSPKRVRFSDVGKEVLPTTSPLTDIKPSQEIPQTPQAPQAPQVPSTSGSNHENRPIGEHVENVAEREESPPPKRISSTQALRALSQMPIEDDGTKWTEVRAPPDGSASIERTGEESGESEDDSEDESEDEFLGFGTRNGKGKGTEALGSNGTSKKPLKSPPPELVSNGDTDTTLSAAEEEDDVLGEMTPLAPMRSAASKAYSTTHTPQMISQTASSQAEKLFDKSQTTSTTHKAITSAKPWHEITNENDPNLGRLSLKNVNSSSDGADDGNEEDQFDFDEAPSKPLSKYTIPEEDEEEMEEEEASQKDRQDARKYSTSPGSTTIKPTADPMSISSPKQVTNTLKSVTGDASSATRPTIITSDSGSGSYRHNHPFDTPIVSANIHAQAASLGALNSFVGSVNGTTGFDADDYAQSPGGRDGATNIGSVMGSGVGSLGANGRGSGDEGQPRSMSERLFMEDFMEMRERERERERESHRGGGRR